MKLLKYLKYSIWDYVLCVLMTTALLINVFQAFYLPVYLATNVKYLLLMTLSIFLLLFLAGYNKKTIVVSLIVFAAVIFLTLFYIQTKGLFTNLSTDTESNGHVYYGLVVFFSVLVFLLSRTRAGVLILFILGSYILSSIVFLEFEYFFWGFLLFLWSSTSMLMCRIYQYNIIHTITAKTSFATFFAISGLLTMLTISIGLGAYVTIIKPLDPPTRELKLITRLQSLEVLEKTGVSSKRILIDPEKTSQDTDDTKRTAQNQENEQREDDLQSYDQNPQSDQNWSDYQIDRIGSENEGQLFYAIRYLQRFFTSLYLIIALSLIIGAMIIGKLLIRRLRYKRILQKNKKEQVIDLYHYYLKSFRWLKLGKKESDTPLEYVHKNSRRLKHFTQGKVDMENLTEIYIKANYGNIPISDEEYNLYMYFHNTFYKNCKTYLGRMRYALSFFIL